ncbi:MAG: hypothetical protein BYD32DRAFT_436205 [Podila humilis]|nr:MAG: hypothetical protein BYD32DRAFT_436205 [Podila humilis]
MVGTTGPLDPNVFPLITGESSTQSFMFGKSTSYTWCTFTVPGNRVCWHIMKQLDSRAADEESFRNSEWTPEANEAIIRDAANFKTPHGTICCLIEQTPKELISRVFLEDKLFETWHHGRTVLIGDACHTTWSEKLLRFAVFNLLLRTFMEKGLLKEGAYRPQVTSMPRILDRGRGDSLPQKPSRRYTEEQQATLPVTI